MTNRQITRYLVPVGRALFATIFIVAAFGHFSERTIGFAAQKGVPLASLSVPFSGIMSLVGGLSILFGYRARLGSLVLIGFLLPVTFAMHDFWNVAEPAGRQLQQVLFLKNLSLLGGALLITHFGAGPLSGDARRNQAG
jgi:putative oxidoreductase